MPKNLRDQPFCSTVILVTGVTGYVGALVAVSLLQNTNARLLCVTRRSHDRRSLLAPIMEEWGAQSQTAWSDAVDSRISHQALPDDLAEVAEWASLLEGVDEIVHCAGCVDYHDTARLKAVNVYFTSHLLVLARKLSLKRFVYISTAYSSGNQPHPTAESLLPEPVLDPTEYTRSKRDAERLVASSDVPFVIIRPSILIGTSQTGRYSGKRYGLYQQWMGLERLACDRYHPEFHTLAPQQPINVLHQDSFFDAFSLAYLWLPNGAFMNLVSNSKTAPSMRELWDMWFTVTRPKTIYFYQSFDDIPFNDIPSRQRAYLTFARVNLEIASHHWQFETRWLDLLRAKGLVFVDATKASVHVCQDRFIASSDLMAKYLTKFAVDLASVPKVVDVSPARVAGECEPANV